MKPTESRAKAARRAHAAAYDRAADGYDQRHLDGRSQRRFHIIDRPQREAARHAQRVLELGCGTGRLLAALDAPVRVGVDISVGMLGRARQRGLAVVLADAHALPFADHSFEAVLAPKGVFRYLDPLSAMRECARVLAPGGQLVVHQYAARTWSPRSLVPPRVRQAWRALRAGGAADAADVGNAANGTDIGDESRHDFAPERTVWHVERLAQLYAPAERAGLRQAATYLWRSIRTPPYALAIPPWLPGALWSHCTVVFRKPPLGRSDE